MKSFMFLSILIFGLNAFSQVYDKAKVLTDFQLKEITSDIDRIRQNHKSRVLIVIEENPKDEMEKLKNDIFNNSKEISQTEVSRKAHQYFDTLNLTNIDVLNYISTEGSSQTFIIGQYAQVYLDHKIRQEFKEKTSDLIKNKKYFESIKENLFIIEREYKIAKEAQKDEASGLLSNIMFFGIAVIVLALLISGFSQTTPSKESYNQYKNKSEFRDRSLSKENLETYKIDMVKILMKRYPDENLYSSYKRLVKQFKKNIKSNNIILEVGHQETKESFKSFVPYYFLMFNSAYLPAPLVDEKFFLQKNRDYSSSTSSDSSSSSSGCAVILSGGCSSSSDSSSSDSGCSTSGCGGCGGGD